MLNADILASIKDSVQSPRESNSDERKEAIERWKRVQDRLRDLHMKAHNAGTSAVVKNLLAGTVGPKAGECAVVLHPKGNALGNMLQKAGVADFIDPETGNLEERKGKRNRQLAVVFVDGFDGNGGARKSYGHAFAKTLRSAKVAEWDVTLKPVVIG